MKTVEQTVVINATQSEVWEYLTDPNLMKGWMSEPSMDIDIITDWVVGRPIIIQGFHHIKFENMGTVLQFDAPKILQYSHLSSISRLADRIKNYSIITFVLTPDSQKTSLTVRIENFPTESIFNHLNFYWQGTLSILKDYIER